MLRDMLGTAYKRTVGALTDWFLGFVTSLTRGGGLIQALYVIFIVALMAGFINAAVFPVANQSYIPYPGGSAMTIPEAVINAFVIIVGAAGIYLTYLSGRQTTRSRTVNLYLGLALLLIVVSVFVGIDMALAKGFG
jgi:hypothetical protein